MPASRRAFLASGAAAALAGAPSRPNLLLIITDQQSHSAMSAAGNPWLRTPAMDSLATQGVRLAEAYATYPVCSPSRSSIFTGCMPHTTDVRVNGKPIAPGLATMGEVLRDSGYDTVYGGKWHLPRSFDGMTGFTRLIGGAALGAKMDAPLADACIDWLRRQPRQPFCLVASFMNPHDVCDWIRRHRGARSYDDPDRFPPAPANMAVDPAEPECVQFHRREGYDLMSQAVGIAAEWTRDDMRFYLHDYYRLVEDVDRQVGRLLTALRESHLDRNTLIAFVSDHGEGLGAHRWVQKAAFYEESVHVPLIFSGPMLPRQGAVDRRNLVSLADILPTFLDYAGVAAPPNLAGVSLRPALEGGSLDRPFVVSELRYGSPEREGRMVRTAHHKYIVFNSGARPEQFFDLRFDPGETLNLARDPASAGLVDEHRSLLRNWISKTGDDFRLPPSLA